MSEQGSPPQRLADVVTIRVETTETGWALSAQTWEALEQIRWLHLQSDRRGLRGVVKRDASSPDPVEVLGPLTRDLAELGTVEIRDDVVLLRSDDASVVALRRRLAEAGIDPLGVLVMDGRPAAVLEAWRAAAAGL